MAITETGFGTAVSTGISTGFSTGNPLAGIIAGTVSLFTSSAADDAQQEYNDALAAIAALNEDRQKAAAVIQKEANVVQHELTTFERERERKSLAYRGTLARAGITAFSGQTGLEGSSVALTAENRLIAQEARARQDSIREQLIGDELFDLAQQRLDVLVSDNPFEALSEEQIITGLEEGNLGVGDATSAMDIGPGTTVTQDLLDALDDAQVQPDRLDPNHVNLSASTQVLLQGTTIEGSTSHPEGSGGEVELTEGTGDRLTGTFTLSSSLLG